MAGAWSGSGALQGLRLRFSLRAVGAITHFRPGQSDPTCVLERVTLRVRSALGTELSGTGFLVLDTGDTCGHVTAVGSCAVQCRTRSRGGKQSFAILKLLWGY